MPWKKAWPSKAKEKLKPLGLSDKSIATLEGYGSLQKFKDDPEGAQKGARKAEVEAALKESRIY